MSIILLLLISAGLNAQFYEYGQDAGRLRWYQFKTPNFHVIFPEGIDSLAEAFANRLEYFYPHLGKPLDHTHGPMPVVIHNEASFSNGVFVWAPRRLEIFTNPDPDGYHQDWLTELALHEGRHAVQIDKLNQGITRALSFLGGEQVVGAMAGFLPYWYLEGDAVDAETRLSMTGRGRQPSFEMALKAQMLEEGRFYSFSKATLGSYKDHIPNHYRLGYLMVRHGRRTYGDQFWIDFQQYVARKPYLISPSYFSMKQYGIRSRSAFYTDAMNEFRKHWIETASNRELTDYKNWNINRNGHFTSYRFPHPVSESMLFAYKSGMDQIPEFVLIGKEGEEKRIFRPGYLSSGRVSFSGNMVVWDEFISDTRWSNRNYSVIRTYEIGSGKVRSLGHKTRYYSPSISKGGSRIAAVEQTAKQQFYLVLLSVDGSIIKKVSTPGNSFIQHPAWMEKDSALVVVLSGESGKFLYEYSPENGNWKRIMSAEYDDISYPVVHGNRIFFSGTFSGIDNIYCYDLTESQTFQVTSSRFGAFHPQVSSDGQILFYSNYGSEGYGIAEIRLEKDRWKPLEKVKNHEEQLDYSQTEYEKEIVNNALPFDTVSYVSRRYYKTLNLFNFHSWLPLYFDYLNPELNLRPEQLPVSPGVSLISQNRLSTTVSQVGYEYKNGFHMFHSGIRLKGRYPILSLFLDYGGEPDILLIAEGESITSVPRDMRFTAQAYIPFRLNTGKFLSIIQPRIDYSYRRDIQYVEVDNNYKIGAHYLYYSLYASTFLRRGSRDILPRLGLTATGGYYDAPFNHQVIGSVSRVGVTGYIPGILKHQTVKLAINYQKQKPANESHPAFVNLMGLPRGLRGVFGEELTTYSVDYVLPLLYPDLELNVALYIKRIRGVLWADHLVGKNVIIEDPDANYKDKNYSTVGFDLLTDLHLLRISFPFTIGGRVTFEPETGKYGFEWLYSIDID